jgi:predicted alpha-1,6-mannanase (GH76 family)
MLKPKFRSATVMLVLIASTLAAVINSHSAPTVAEYHQRADQALQSFLLKFWDGNQQYLRHWYPSDGNLTGYWTYAQGWDALADGVERTSGRQYAGLLDAFYIGQQERGWFVGYYDDECWMSMVLTRAYDLTSDPKFLLQAQTIYADVMTGWDTNCCGAIKGGVWWDKAHTQKATAANAGAALAGARLFQRTANASYLSFAQQVYSFWYANMVNAGTGQVCDHINPDGTKVWWQFTYNEGLMIGASLELYLATGNTTYLSNAHRIAGYLINNEVTSTAYGPVLYDGNNSGCGGDCHQFKGVAYRYLSRLYALDRSKSQYYTVLRASADAVWALARETNATIFSVNWAGPPQSTVDQPQDNSGCMALSRFAQLAGPYPGSGAPGNQYEAENAVVNHIGFEAVYGNFTGWGYLAGWNGSGTSVEFRINCATAGPHDLLFRYAAGAGNASRVIKVNGVALVANQVFTNTGAWSSYGTLQVSSYLPVGASTVSVLFDSEQLSSNWLNLDHLRVLGDAPEEIRISSMVVSPAGTVQLSWNSRIGETYFVQFRSSLTAGAWNVLGSALIASGTNMTGTDALGTNEARYYRVSRP